MSTITISKREYQELKRKAQLLEQFFALKERLAWEERDTDEAIKISEQEKKEGNLKKVKSFKRLI